MSLNLKKKIEDIELDDVIELLYDLANEQADNPDESAPTKNRIISDNVSIRKGKYGDYIFYKSKTMRKPRFLKLDGFVGDYMTCDIALVKQWFKEKYKIDA